ncbi:bifunctional 4-hydroxy-2-oxoglutarate aldolase/2-dehydro-3-deoxy-phosphogluconate aldolase [Nocardiopsis sp. NPDC058789]|uniref:bifunctional 4-hydroxy-2-oxoglutarate aldolase/2-dehydro-3-deoxy-phosphogluconate aldolase n=1 Tax=Nocardiopsis TaxID=2013 RepID=UPI0036718ECC
MSDEGLDGLFAEHSVLAILRGMPVRTTVELAERAWDLGVTAIEVPARDPEGLEALHATVRAGAERGHPVGAGTVITPEQVRAVSEAGAAFTVAPGFDAEVMALSEAAGMPHLPGVATPTDIQGVLRAGGHWVKAFPASSLGTGWFRAMSGPFPDVRIVATGGMDAHNARRYLDAGARMVAVGSALTDPEQIPLLAALV